MKIVKPEVMDKLYAKRMEEFTKQYSFIYLDTVEKFKKKSKYFFMIIFFVLFLPVLYVAVSPDIAPLFSDTSTRFEIIITIIALFFLHHVVLFIHELIHLLVFPSGWKRKYIVFKRPMICAVYDGFTSKKRDLVVLMAPVTIISGAIVILHFVFGVNLSIILMLTLLNIVSAMQDIYVFFDALKRAPKNSYRYGSAFTTDITKEMYKELVKSYK